MSKSGGGGVSGEQIAGERCKESFIYFLNGDCSDELLQSKLKGDSEADVTAEIDKMICFFSLSFRYGCFWQTIANYPGVDPTISGK